jgi:hypothetical protein
LNSLLKQDPERALQLADRIIRNTYRTLLTRGQKGCFVFCTDNNLSAYLKSRLKGQQRVTYQLYASQSKQHSKLLAAEGKADYKVDR